MENQHEDIYACFSEPPLLTVIIGAKCSDGVVLVADKKLTNIFGGKPEFKDKIFGDLGHFLIEYTGLEEVFRIFRKSIVGDWQLMLSTDPYTFDNFISRCSPAIRVLNGIACRPNSFLQVLIGKHRWRDTELYHIDVKGNHNKINYITIGSGKDVTDKICRSLPVEKIKMKDFVKHAYLAIMYMDQYCPGLGVGMGSDGAPRIKYLHYEDEWDKEATSEDIEEYKIYADKKLEQIKRSFENFVKE